MNIRTIIFIVFIAAWFAGGCESIKSGTVTGKEHQPESTTLIMIPTLVGKITVMIPYYLHDDEDWIIHLKSGDESGSVYVSKQVYESINIGDNVDLCDDEVCEQNTKVRK